MPSTRRARRLSQASSGARVKALREAGGLSLRELAERSGVSAPMLSQVERGETSPTLTVAARIAAGLDLRLSQLLRLDEQGAVTITRAGRAPPRRQPAARAPRRDPHGRAGRAARRALAPHPRPGRFHRGSRRPADARAGKPRERPRGERARSSFTATARNTSFMPGDCVTFDADLPHRFENNGTDEASLLAVVTRRAAGAAEIDGRGGHRWQRRCSRRSGRHTRSHLA